MFCKHCGTMTKEGAKFCGACGKPIATNVRAQQINPAASPAGDPAQPESRRSTLEPAAPTVEALRIPGPSPKPAIEANAGVRNPNRLMIGISIALILGLAIGAVSFYLLRLGSRPDGSMSTASTTAPPAARTATPSPNAPQSTNQAATPNAVSPPSGTCFDLSKHEPHFLTGELRSTVFADEPGYADVRNGDDPVEGYLLALDTSICIREDNNDYGSADPKVQISEVQVYPKDWDLQIEAAMRSLIGYRVRVTLFGAQSAMTGHDHRPLVAQVSSIVPLDANAAHIVIPRTMSPQTDAVALEQGLGVASTTVRAFYEALSLGNGEIASSLVVAEKRSSGPYAPDSINGFYGPLPEPLRLTELKAQGLNEYLAKYTYATSTRRCQGRAIVTTTQRDGLNFIERIHELEGCGAVSSRDKLSVADSNRTRPRGPINGDKRLPIQSAPTPSTASASTHTNIRWDPQHPLKIGEDFYPASSKRANEEGRCVLKLRVAADGRIADQAIQESSGFSRLDEACVSAVRGQRMLPATENGRPVETTGAFAIVWKLTNK